MISSPSTSRRPIWVSGVPWKVKMDVYLAGWLHVQGKLNYTAWD